jgi:hypothetical protein
MARVSGLAHLEATMSVPATLRAIVLLLAIPAVSVAQGEAPHARATGDSAERAMRESVVAVAHRFFVVWDSLWREGQRYSHNFLSAGEGQLGGVRGHNLHCHPDIETSGSAVDQGRLIKARRGAFSVCPSWDLGDGEMLDERISLDTVLRLEDRIVARAARQVLIAALDSAAQRLPRDDFIAGQRIRFLVDQRDVPQALRVARECAASPWWCAALTGYVRAAANDVVGAEAAFASALSSMPRERRCEWTDHRAVLDDASRDKYADVSCAARDELNTRLWWMADPLLIEPGNARRVEQYVRIVQVDLRSAMPRDERYSWNDEIGNDARRAMISRYGWPAYASWGGPTQDSGHTGYLRVNTSPPNPPYTTYEYTGARSHVIPVWRAIADPFRALPEDWNLMPPDPRETPPPPRQVATGPILFGPGPTKPAAPKFWWPAEHFQPANPLTQLPHGQRALLRRKDGALLAVATDLSALRLGMANGDTVPAVTLVTSTGPDDIRRIATATGIVGTPFEIHGLIGAAEGVAGIEYLAVEPSVPVAGRLRFGIAPLAPLAALTPGQFASSDPVLLRTLAGGATLPSEPDRALRLMATSHVVSASGQIGVYWETYGFKPTDSVEVAVWIERYTSQGIARAFGIALGVARDLNTPVSVSWKEPQPGYRSHVFHEGGVPVIGRAVSVDVSQLLPGDYRLEVAVRKAGAEPVRGRSTFVVK